mmetsp:Transcript_48299/g.53800  ORF Transcript_48299/g.53800 Transcript_48299/m.53800 type:complete len:321 (-) Transcript_48299:520-1482(-)
MGDNIAAIHNDGDGLVEVIYGGGRLDNFYYDENFQTLGFPQYNIPAGVNIRLRIDVSVTKITMHACFNCARLIEVVFHKHNNVITIGREAFSGCSNLQRMELPEGLLRLERDAFFGCTSLRGIIVIPASIQYMGDAVFERCTSLESVVFAPRTTNIELGLFMFRDCSDLRFVTLPPNLRLIPRGCFQGCTSLTHFHIPESVEEIEGDALYGSGLQSVTISENVRRIRWAAYENCAFLERVTIHSTNVTMPHNIFANCPLLSVIKIYQWMWPKVFASMKGQPDFIFKFFREYHTKIFDFETPKDVSVSASSTITKKQTKMI